MKGRYFGYPVVEINLGQIRSVGGLGDMRAEDIELEADCSKEYGVVISLECLWQKLLWHKKYLLLQKYATAKGAISKSMKDSPDL